MVTPVEVREWVRKRMASGGRKGIPSHMVDAHFGPGTVKRSIADGALIWRNANHPNRVKPGWVDLEATPTNDGTMTQTELFG